MEKALSSFSLVSARYTCIHTFRITKSQRFPLAGIQHKGFAKDTLYPNSPMGRGPSSGSITTSMNMNMNMQQETTIIFIDGNLTQWCKGCKHAAIFDIVSLSLSNCAYHVHCIMPLHFLSSLSQVRPIRFSRSSRSRSS